MPVGTGGKGRKDLDFATCSGAIVPTIRENETLIANGVTVVNYTEKAGLTAIKTNLFLITRRDYRATTLPPSESGVSSFRGNGELSSNKDSYDVVRGLLPASTFAVDAGRSKVFVAENLCDGLFAVLLDLAMRDYCGQAERVMDAILVGNRAIKRNLNLDVVERTT